MPIIISGLADIQTITLIKFHFIPLDKNLKTRIVSLMLGIILKSISVNG